MVSTSPSVDSFLPRSWFDRFSRHLLDDDSRLGVGVRLLENLSFADAGRRRPVCFDLLHRAGLKPPGVVYQDLCIYAESVVEHILSGKAEPGQFAHRVDTEGFQPPDCAGAGLPEISQRLVIPEEITEGLLIQFCNTHTILIGRSDGCCKSVGIPSRNTASGVVPPDNPLPVTGPSPRRRRRRIWRRGRAFHPCTLWYGCGWRCGAALR